MRYVINEHEVDVEIQVLGATGRTSQVLESMRECQAGRVRLSNRLVRPAHWDGREAADDEVTVRLQPLPGQRLDLGQLRACLDYTIAAAED